MTITDRDGTVLLADASDLFGRAAFTVGTCPGCNTEAELVAYPLCWLCSAKREARAQEHALRQCYDRR